MKAVNKMFFAVSLAIFALLGSVFAAPFYVESVNFEDDNNVVVVSVENTNVEDYDAFWLDFTIEELGTMKKIGPIELNEGIEEFKYDLDEITDNYDALKQGEVYRLSVSADDDTDNVTETFLFGNNRVEEDFIIEKIEINGVEIRDNAVRGVEVGETVDVEIVFIPDVSADDARIRLELDADDNNLLTDTTDRFNVVEGVTKSITMSIKLPENMDAQEDNVIRLTGLGPLSELNRELDVYVDTDRHRVDIEDLVMVSSSGVEPGQNIIANVRMENRGQKDQDSVKVEVAVPELGVREFSYISNLGAEEVATSDDMLLSIPSDAKAGQYDVEVTLSYNDGYSETTETFTLNVLAPQVVSEKNLLVSFDETIDLVAGETTTFDVVVANPNKDSKPISLAAVDNAWAEVNVNPSLKMVEGGSDAVFTVSVTPKDSIAGEKELTLLVKEGAVTISDVNVNTYVEASQNVNWVNVVLAVLLVIAVIILIALVITVARKKGDDREDDVSSEEYY